MTPAQLDKWAETHIPMLREEVNKHGRMALYAAIIATYRHDVGPIEPTHVPLRTFGTSPTEHEWLAGMARGAAAPARALAVICAAQVHDRIVVAYERTGRRRTWSAVYSEGQQLRELVEEPVTGVMENLLIPPTIHILKHGRSLCNKPGVPGEWEPGHFWIGLTETDFSPDTANCPTCKANLSLIVH